MPIHIIIVFNLKCHYGINHSLFSREFPISFVLKQNKLCIFNRIKIC